MSTASAGGRADALVRAMPVVFVLIWATGFIVARYGMPHAPPMKFLAVRYALSVGAFLAWALLARAAWPRSRGQFGTWRSPASSCTPATWAACGPP